MVNKPDDFVGRTISFSDFDDGRVSVRRVSHAKGLARIVTSDDLGFVLGEGFLVKVTSSAVRNWWQGEGGS